MNRLVRSTPFPRWLAAIASSASIACLAVAGAQAAEPTGVLKRVKDSGQITVGYRESSIPFSYLDDKAQPVGYTMELCNRVIDALKKELKLPSLAVKLQAVTSQNRIPLVVNGTVDMECGSTVNNVERQAQVAFSDTTFVVATRFIARRADNLKTIDDLRGKTVAVTTGTNTVKRVRDLDAAHKLGLTMINGKDHADSMLLMTSGRASAFFEDDILLVGLAASSPAPNDFALSVEGYSVDPYSIMLPKGDAEFKKLVDAVLVDLFRSGEINGIYDRWFMKPIPPKNITLNFPMGAALKNAIAKPTDSAEPADYK
jgi:glutamate/aspartate transport system substrate-binding protein